MAGVKLTLKRVFVKGKLCFELPEDTRAIEAMSKVLRLCRDKNNDYVCVSLDTPRRPRTTGPKSQNHKLNGMLMQICQETGNDYDTVKYCAKMIAVEELGYPFKVIADHILPQGERACSTEECAKLIEATYILGAQLGIVFREIEE